MTEYFEITCSFLHVDREFSVHDPISLSLYMYRYCSLYTSYNRIMTNEVFSFMFSIRALDLC